MSDTPLDQQACGNCYSYRPHLDRSGGRCCIDPPVRVGKGIGAQRPTTAQAWCRKWELHPNGLRADYRPPEPLPVENNPVEPQLPAAVVPLSEAAASRGITQPGGRVGAVKWKRDPGPDMSKAPPELRPQAGVE